MRVLAGHDRVTWARVGHMDGMATIGGLLPEEEDLDVLFYGALNERRRRVLEDCLARGLRVEHLFGVYGAARDRFIARAKLVLNVHFYPTQIFEAIRVSYLLSNRKVVLSEWNDQPESSGPATRDAFEPLVVRARYEDLADMASLWAQAFNGPLRAGLARRVREQWPRHDAREFLLAAMRATEGLR
jgi:hypothetical protein